MKLYSPTFLREDWHRRGAFAELESWQYNHQEDDHPSGFGEVPVMQVLHERLILQDELPELDSSLVWWLGKQHGVCHEYEHWERRARKLILDWSAEIYCLYLLQYAATGAGLSVSIGYRAADDYRGIDATLEVAGHPHLLQLKRHAGRDDPWEHRKYFRRLARGEAEAKETIFWHPPFDQLDKRWQPWVPRLQHAEELFVRLEDAGVQESLL